MPSAHHDRHHGRCSESFDEPGTRGEEKVTSNYFDDSHAMKETATVLVTVGSSVRRFVSPSVGSGAAFRPIKATMPRTALT